MKYDKPPLTYDQQADLLLRRGLTADRDELVSRLRSVSYYRLSGYWYPFRLADDSFRPGTTFETVWRRYRFDRRLRLLALDAIERVEVRIRTELVYVLAHAQGPFGYCASSNQLPEVAGGDNLRPDLPWGRRGRIGARQACARSASATSAIPPRTFWCTRTRTLRGAMA